MLRRSFHRAIFSAAVAAAWAPLGTAPAFAQEAYPNKPIRLLVGFTAGGSADNVARVLAAEMGRTLGQQIIVENKPGASANLAAQALVNSPADGYTLLLVGFSHLTNPSMIKKLGYDPENDLSMVSQIGALPIVALTRSESPLNNLNDVVNAAKTKKGGISIASGGIGTSSHFGAELLARASNVRYVHVPYKGGAPAFQGLLSGDVDLMFDFLTPSLKSSAEAGKIKFLGVMQKEPIKAFPKAQPAGAQGFSAAAFMRPWQAIAVRSGTPQAVVAALHRSMTAVLKNDDVARKLEMLGTDVHMSANPTEMDALYKADMAKWTKIVQDAGISAE